MSTPTTTSQTRQGLVTRYEAVRAFTERLADPLSPEDQLVQSMPDVSPTKWHRAHTSWFFETFLLGPHLPGYEVFEDVFEYLYNSYYEAVGERHPRTERGLVSRPSAADISYYRQHVDAAMHRLFSTFDEDDPRRDLVELGLHHEEQHQELLLMDIKHVFWTNPLRPAYLPLTPESPLRPSEVEQAGWVVHDGGVVEVGHAGSGFAFDNESPRHEHLVQPFALADRLVTAREWQDFIEDGGYDRPEFWLSDGWAWRNLEDIDCPLYWIPADHGWHVNTLHGTRPVQPDEPVCHVSHYEADAFASWAGARLPTEVEWEVAAVSAPGPVAFEHLLHPQQKTDGFFGEVWQWTSSPYVGYPGFAAAEGAVGEYNGKFMSNQMVLRGSACITSRGHSRSTYRNFFPPSARWAFAGLRLARDA